MMLNSTLVAHALRERASQCERHEFAEAVYIGLKIGAVIFLVLLAMDVLTSK